MRCRAMQYARHAVIISPESLSNDVKSDILQAEKNYNFRKAGDDSSNE